MTTEKKIEIIKHYVDRAEWFTFCNEGDDIYPEYMLKHNHWDFWPSGSDFVSTGMWSLFLQRAIEGVNRESYYGDKNQREIVIRRWGVEICSYLTEDHSVRYFRFEADIGYTVDDAKLAALEWIMEKEKEA